MAWDDEVDERSGGLLMAYTGKLQDVFFGPGKFGTQLTIEVKLDNPEDHPHIPDGVIKNWFGTGQGWEPVNNGASVEYRGAPRKDGLIPTKFNGNTAAGRLVAQMQAVDPEGVTLAAGRTTEAAYWKAAVGYARWGAVNVPKREQQTDGSYKDVAGGKDVSMPVELLNVASSNGAVHGLDITTLQLDDPTLALVTAAAQSAKDYQSFVAAAIPTLAGNPVMAKVGDSTVGPQIYEALRLI